MKRKLKINEFGFVQVTIQINDVIEESVFIAPCIRKVKEHCDISCPFLRLRAHKDKKFIGFACIPSGDKEGTGYIEFPYDKEENLANII